MRGGKNLQFSLLSWETVRDRSIVTRKSQVADRSVVDPITLSDLKGGKRGNEIFPSVLCNCACSIWPRRTTRGRRAYIYGVTHIPPQNNGAGLQLLQNFWPHLRSCDQTWYSNTWTGGACFKRAAAKWLGPSVLKISARTQHEKHQLNFAWGQTRYEEKFNSVDHARCPGQTFCWHERWRAICLR